MPKPCIRITLRIPTDLHAIATDLAKSQDRSLNWMLINLMQQGIGTSHDQSQAAKGGSKDSK